MAGQPVHIEIPAQDTNRAQEFYKNLFGWQFQGMEGPVEYHMARLSENTGSAIFPGDTGAIRVYFDVDDINSGAAKVKELGGKVDDPQPVPGMGWFATGTADRDEVRHLTAQFSVFSHQFVEAQLRKVLNAADLGLPTTLPAQGSNQEWGDKFSVGKGTGNSPLRPTIDFTIPKHSSLSGKTLRLSATMT